MEKKQNKTKVVFLSVLTGIGLLVVLAAAYGLYGKLSSNYQTEQLAVYENKEEKEKESQEQKGAEEEQKDHAQTDQKEESTEEVSQETKAQEEQEGVSQEETSQEESATATAPDFSVYDAEGNPVRLQDFRGKPVVLNFWASWCGPCRSEMPDFQSSYEKYGEEIHFLMVNLTDGTSETVEVASEFIQKEGYSFPVYFDSQQEAAITYGIMSIPTTFFIDESGTIIANGQGALDGETLQKGIDMIYSQP